MSLLVEWSPVQLPRVHKEPTQTQGMSLRKAKEERDNCDPAFSGGVAPVTLFAEALLSLEAPIQSVENWMGDTDSHSRYNAWGMEHPLAYDEVKRLSWSSDGRHETRARGYANQVEAVRDQQRVSAEPSP